MSETWWNSFV